MTNKLEEYRAKFGDVDQSVSTLQTYLETFTVESQEQAIKLGEIRVTLNNRLKEIEKERKAIADPQYKAWKATGTFFKKFSGPVKTLIPLVDGKLRGWENLQKQKQLQAQKAAQEAANRAMEAQAQGDAETAAEAFTEAQEAVAVAVRPTEAAVGLQRRENWVAEVTDVRAFLAYVATLENPLAIVSINNGVLNKIARETRVEGPVKDLPGVTIKKVIGFAS